MKRRLLLNLLLLAVVIALSLLAWLGPGTAPPPKEPPRLLPLAREAVSEIRIDKPGAEPIVLRKEGERWRVVAPIAAPANRFRIDSLLELTGSRSQSRFPAVAAELARYGLAAPKVILTLGGERIEFGDTSPLDGRRYVRVGDTVQLIPDVAYYHVAGDANTFVDLSPLGQEAEVVGLALPGLSLERQEGRWQVTPEGRLSQDEANALADAWRRAQAIEVRVWAGGATEGELRVRLANRPEPVVLLLARDAKASDLVLVRPDLKLAYHLAGTLRKELLPGAAEGK